MPMKCANEIPMENHLFTLFVFYSLHSKNSQFVIEYGHNS